MYQEHKIGTAAPSPLYPHRRLFVKKSGYVYDLENQSWEEGSINFYNYDTLSIYKNKLRLKDNNEVYKTITEIDYAYFMPWLYSPKFLTHPEKIIREWVKFQRKHNG